jgi:hypothetical protein
VTDSGPAILIGNQWTGFSANYAPSGSLFQQLVVPYPTIGLSTTSGGSIEVGLPVINGGDSSTTWSLTGGTSWLTLQTTGGTLASDGGASYLYFQCNSSGLSAGTYYATLSLEIDSTVVSELQIAFTVT